MKNTKLNSESNQHFKKFLHLKLISKTSKPSDSITTTSLMAVLSGTFFITIITNPTIQNFNNIDKYLIPLVLLISMILFFKAIELTIDIFHYKENNSIHELKNKFKLELYYYNFGVILLLLSSIYLLVGFIFCKIISNNKFSNFIYYLIIIFLTYFISLKWIKDLCYVYCHEVLVETEENKYE